MTPEKHVDSDVAAAPFTIPHAPKEAPMGITFEQAVAGLRQTFPRWTAAEGAFQKVANMLEGKPEGPIISWPSGQKDAEGNQLYCEVDFNVMLQSVPEEQRTATLAPLHSYLVEDHNKWLSQIVLYAVSALQAADPERLTQVLRRLRMLPQSSPS